ncbi:MAG TPA: hypothetical protein VGV13_04505 [Methylomirabilota bacterium]|nr:hypothetical protein [Methylomirabilota bacterium]
MIQLVAGLALLGLWALTVFAQGVGGLTGPPAQEVPGPNLLDNGGFETTTPDNVPAKWSARDGGLWSIDTSAHSGRASLKLAGVDRQQSVPSTEQAVTLTPGFYTLEGWVKTAGLGAARERSGVRFCLDGRPRLNWWKCTTTVRGTADWTLLRQALIAVTDPGTYRVAVGAYGLPDGVAWFDDMSLTQVRRPALDAYLLYPNFRGMLFDDRPQTVRVAVAVTDVAEAQRSKARVRVSLLEEANGSVRASRDYPTTPARFTAELDARPLAPGAYLVRVDLVGEGGDALYRAADYRIVKAAAKTRERLTVWYDERNVTYLEGKPAFILGLYNTTGYTESRDTYARGQDDWGNARIAEAPINMLINYWLGRAPVPALYAYMDDLHSRGIYYLQTVNFYYVDDPQYREIPYPAAREGEDALNRWVARTLAKHRGLAGFYTADERPADMVPKVLRQHRALSEAAPGTVTYAVLGDGWENQAPLWRDSLDVMGLDPYPITKPRGQNDLAMVGEWTRLGQDAVQGSRPLWMVIQYFPLTSAGGWPTYEELRVMSWMAIIEGARGLVYWSFGARGLSWVKEPAQRQQHWRNLVAVTKEIKGLERVLLAPDAPVVARESSGGAVRTLGKRLPDGTRYLFAYNSKNTPARVTWALAEPAQEAADLGKSTPLKMDGAQLTAEFGPYEVKRYRLR